MPGGRPADKGSEDVSHRLIENALHNLIVVDTAKPLKHILRMSMIPFEFGISSLLKVGSALFTAAAAYCWLQVTRINTPLTMGLTADQTNFDWLTRPLTDQAWWNTHAAFCACVAAIFQILMSLRRHLTGSISAFP
jgi:ABC-type branched-subunit amino acid transport system permease subunit